MRKKFFSILTSVICAVSMLSTAVFTNASAVTVAPPQLLDKAYENFTYRDRDSDGDGTIDSVAITGCTSEAESIEIPEKIYDLPVKYIYEAAFENNTKLKSIKLPDSVTDVNKNAFSGCTALENVTLSKNLQSIEIGVFYKCSSLTNIVIPDSVTSISSSAFLQCTSLKEINIPDSVTMIAYDAFKNTEILNKQTGVKYIDKWLISCDADIELSECIIKDGTVGIAGSAFFKCSGIKSIVIPDSVIYLGGSAFSRMQSLENIDLGNSVNSISGSCFDNCTSLNNVVIPESVKSIDVTAFSNCTALTSITLPDSITDIGSRAFMGCTSLEKIILPKNLTELRDVFFGCTSLKTVELPENLTDIKDNAFYQCKSLENIDIPDSVSYIGSGAFKNTALLNNQTDKVKYVDSWLIECDTTATECTIKDTTKVIASSAFANCTELKSIVIPNSVTLLNNNAFEKCSSLETVILGNGLKNIEDSVFSGCQSLKNVIIPDSVTSLGRYVFNGCSKLASIKLPDSISEIGKSAFYKCTSLESIVIPESCQIINADAFSYCESLNKITILNADCEIYDSYSTISNRYGDDVYHMVYDGTIYGYADSAAQAYAEKYDYNFSVLENTEPPVMYGDVSGDGVVNKYDIEILQEYLVKKRTLETNALKRADMNRDGKVNVFDSILLKRRIMNINIYLEPDKKKISTDEQDTTTYFYADVYAENVTVKLYNASTDELIMEMVDDGKYSISGDDLMNDGIYSCKLKVDNSTAKNFYYYAKIEESGEKSDYCTIKVYNKLTDQDLNDMKTVNKALSDLFSSSEFSSASESERKAKADELFIKLISEGLIVDVSYNEKNKAYKYTYKCGVEGYESIKSLEVWIDGDNIPLN